MPHDRLRPGALRRSAGRIFACAGSSRPRLASLALPPRVAPLAPLVLLATLALSMPGKGLAGPFADPGWDAAAMVAWASAVDDFSPGPLDAAAPELGVADFGLPELALGPATLDAFDVVSLGDGGWIVLHFDVGIVDGNGDDFAVFENGFLTVGGLFAELAFVEVSSNGVDFARLPAQTVNALAVDEYSPLDPSDYDNLAGDQPIGIGTGFDLAELATDPLAVAGSLDLDDVRFVRVVDVIGSGATTDAFGAPVYDPYPTAFAAGGFDLEAVGVIHAAPEPGFAAGLALGALALGARRSGWPGCRRAR